MPFPSKHLDKFWHFLSFGIIIYIQVRLGYCFSPYQRLWLYNGALLVAFYDTLGIRRTYSRPKPPASSRGELYTCTPYNGYNKFDWLTLVLRSNRTCRISFGILSSRAFCIVSDFVYLLSISNNFPLKYSRSHN